MIPNFTLQRGKMEYLIIRMGDEFHIIDCDEALTKEKKFAILESGCTPAQMQEMGLSGMTIPKSDIKALTVTGCGFQDDVIFYLNKKKLAFWFPQAYEQKRVDDFFRGIPRKMVKTRYRLKGGKHADWRMTEQKPELYRKLRPVGWGWNVLCIVILILLLMNEISFAHWSLVVLLMAALGVVLDSILPVYFTLLLPGKMKRGIKPIRAIKLGYGLSVLAFGFTTYCAARYHILEDAVISVSLVFTVVIGGGLLLLCREFREEFGKWLISLVLIFAISFFGIVPHLNHELGEPPVSQTGTVIQKVDGSSGRGRRTYHFTVRLPDGNEVIVGVNREEYHDCEIGDPFELRVGTGFFGIEYAIDG